jgi:hypothetical protein
MSRIIQPYCRYFVLMNRRKAVFRDRQWKLQSPTKHGLLGLLLSLLFGTACVAQVDANKRIILAGHDAPDSNRYLSNLLEYESLPFDGFAIRLDCTEEGVIACNNREPGRTAFSATSWKSSWFNESVKRLAKANETLPRETFILFNCNPGDVDWFDDQGWHEIVDHFRILARAAKASRSRGLIFDAEPYPSDKPVVPFSYERQPQRGQHSLVEYQAQARLRGRQSMRAMADEYPDLVILSFFLTSYLTQDHSFRGANVVTGDSLQTQYAAHNYNLLVPFLMGWLDEVPDSMRIVDGNEEAYYYSHEYEYLAAAQRIEKIALEMFPEELRPRYRQVVRTGQAVYLDNCQPAHRLYTEIPHHTPQQILAKRLDWALRSADEYVWIWAEGGRFLKLDPELPRKNQFRSKFKHWDELFPGALATFALTRDSSTCVERLIRLLAMEKRQNRVVPLLNNGRLETGKDRLANWVIWQPPRTSFGKLQWNQQASQMVIAGTAGGLIAQDVRVEPGQTVHVVAKCEKQGEGEPFVAVGVLDRDKKHVKGSVAPPSLLRQINSDTGELVVHGRWIVPEGCSIFRILCGAHSQGDADDILRINEVQAYRILPIRSNATPQ